MNAFIPINGEIPKDFPAGWQRIGYGNIEYGDIIRYPDGTKEFVRESRGFPISYLGEGCYIYRKIPVPKQGGEGWDKVAERIRNEAVAMGADPDAAAGVTEKPTNPKDAIGIAKLPVHLVSGIVKAYQSIAHFLGNVKYGAWNYRGAGVRYSVYKAAMDRHMDAWWEGEEYDPTDGTPHIANAMCCLNLLIEGKFTPGSIDDRPPSRCKELAKVRAEFEALMPKIREKYKDKNPKHWTIADKP